MDRRRFLYLMGTTLAAGCSSAPAAIVPTETSGTVPPISASIDPLPSPEVSVPETIFGLGVASGDPTPSAVVLWTRLLPDEDGDLPVVWELARDADFVDLVATGEVVAMSEFGHSIHVDVTGLEASTTYHYRFRTGPQTSRHGRTKTLPAPHQQVAELRLGFANCQLFERGYYEAHRHLGETPLDAVVFLGDFIYEYSTSDALQDRQHTTPEAHDLAGYRERYRQYRAENSLQIASAAHPWFITWDDHEVLNDYPQSAVPIDRVHAAYQAWWENMPVRLTPGDYSIYRVVSFGDVAQMALLDCRQYATESEILGSQQWQYVEEGLTRADEPTAPRWTLFCSSVLTSSTDIERFDALVASYAWVGFADEQRRLQQLMARCPHPLVVSGDLHMAMELQTPSATEWVCPPISSRLPTDYQDLAPFLPVMSNVVTWVEAQNGWLELNLSHTETTATFHLLSNAADATATIVSQQRPSVA